jgi:hypothetical protein
MNRLKTRCRMIPQVSQRSQRLLSSLNHPSLTHQSLRLRLTLSLRLTLTLNLNLSLSLSRTRCRRRFQSPQ